jgi:anti-sigma factor RsiW
MSRDPHHLSLLTLDALALGALPPDREAQARDHIATCARCLAESEEGERSRDHFRLDVLARTMPHIQRRADRPRWRRAARPALLVPALAAAAILLFVVLSRREETTSQEADLRIKGGAILQVFAHRNGHVFRVEDGTSLAPGDRIRFVVYPAGLPYLLIASVDGAGVATVYFPYGGHQSERIQTDAAPRIELPDSIALDAAPGPERIHAIFSREPVSADAVEAMLSAVGAGGAQAIRNHQHLDIPAPAQATVYFEKALP